MSNPSCYCTRIEHLLGKVGYPFPRCRCNSCVNRIIEAKNQVVRENHSLRLAIVGQQQQVDRLSKVFQNIREGRLPPAMLRQYIDQQLQSIH